MTNNKEISFLDAIDFIFRHPWAFAFPFFIIISTIFTFVLSSSLSYECVAIISFESPAETTPATAKAISEVKNNILSIVLLGENVREIVNNIWPEVNEKMNPALYEYLIRYLKKNVKVSPEQNLQLIDISFSNPNPYICYKVVKSAINTIISETNKFNTERLEINLSFLRKQVAFYKDKIKNIEKESSSIKNNLFEIYPQLSDDNRRKVRETLGKQFEQGAAPGSALQKFIQYEKELTQLNLQLLDAQAKKETIQKYLGTTESLSSSAAQSFSYDNIVMQYSKDLGTKESALATLLSQDATPEHPDVIKLKAQIASLNKLIEKRIKELTEMGAGLPKAGGQQAEQGTIDFQIQTLKDKIILTEKYLSDYKKGFKEPQLKIDSLTDDLIKLTELENENNIVTDSYKKITKQLEESELKSRAEIEKFGINIRIIEEPRVPIRPRPFQRITRLVLGLIFALAAGFATASLIDSMIEPIKSGKELREFLMVPVIGSISRIVTPEELKSLLARRRNFVYILLGLSLALGILTYLFTATKYK